MATECDMVSITISLSLPAKPLWQNTSCHWRRKAEAVRRMRDEAFLLSKQYKLDLSDAQLGALPLRSARAKLIFFWPDRRRRDTRNAEAAMKPAYDGLIDAGILSEDHSGVLSHDETEMLHDPANPHVVLSVREL